MDKKRITIIGAGYVGLGTAAIFSKKHQITILDIDKEKIEMINSSNIKNQAIIDEQQLGTTGQKARFMSAEKFLRKPDLKV